MKEQIIAKQTSPLLIWCIVLIFTTTSYFVAFHNKRSENKELKEKLKTCQEKK